MNQKEEIQNAAANSPRQHQRDIFNTENEDETTPFDATHDESDNRQPNLNKNEDPSHQHISRYDRRTKNQSMDNQITRTYTTHKLYSDYLHQQYQTHTQAETPLIEEAEETDLDKDESKHIKMRSMFSNQPSVNDEVP